jgi:hypothetical protein
MLHEALSALSRGTTQAQAAISPSSTSDAGLEYFRNQEDIYRMMTAELYNQSKQPQIPEVHSVVISASSETRGAELPVPQDLAGLLANYQRTLRCLLNDRSYVGFPPHEMDEFKRELGFSAFTCRYRLCAYATAGFSNEELLLEHEVTHVMRITCPEEGCPYPPFISSRALKSHKTKCHGESQQAPRINKIRMTTAQPDAKRIEPQNPEHGPAGLSNLGNTIQANEITALQAQPPPSINRPNLPIGGGIIDGNNPTEGPNVGLAAQLPSLNGNNQEIADSLEIPVFLYQQFGISPEIKRWKDLKLWLSQNPTAPIAQHRTRLSQVQLSHFGQWARNRQVMLQQARRQKQLQELQELQQLPQLQQPPQQQQQRPPQNGPGMPPGVPPFARMIMPGLNLAEVPAVSPASITQAEIKGVYKPDFYR